MGAPRVGRLGEGAAYVFQEPVGGWVSMTETAELTNAQGSKDELGWSIATLAGTVVAGAPNTATAYVFVEPTDGWVNTGMPTATLTSTQSTIDFGYSVAINPNMILVGDPNAKTGWRQNNGGAYAYIEPVDGWKNATESAKLLPKGGSANQEAGWAVGAELNSKGFLGSPLTTVGQNQNQGAVFVMTVKEK